MDDFTYKDGTGSLEIVSNEYVKITCKQENKIILGATATVYGGSSVAFDALPLAIASTDGIDTNLSAGIAIETTVTAKHYKPHEAETKNFYTETCKDKIASCTQKINNILGGAYVINNSVATYAQKTSIEQSAAEITEAATSVETSKTTAVNTAATVAAKEAEINQSTQSQIAFLETTIAQLKKIHTSLTEIASSRSNVGAANQEKGSVKKEMAGIINK